MLTFTRLCLFNFRRFRKLDLEFNDSLNIIVGNNECGKSTVLHGIHLALTGQVDGRNARFELDPFLFHQDVVAEFFAKRRAGESADPPRLLVELYFRDDGTSESARYKGMNNSLRRDEPGIYFAIELDDDLSAQFDEYVRDPESPAILPVEYFRSVWRSFADDAIDPRRTPVRSVLIDGTLRRSRHEPNRFVARMVGTALDSSQQRALALSYRKQRGSFADLPEIRALNAHLASAKKAVSEKEIAVALDMSARSTWENDVTTHLDRVPFELVGSGEQAKVRVKLAIANRSHGCALLVEEPENHLSHSNMSGLLDDIASAANGDQVVVTTHSTFVLNKLGLDKLLLLAADGSCARLSDLEADTRDYFMKLPGFNTLRMLLAKKAILVEGPSDELILLKGFKQRKGKSPLEDGVDVISVGGVTFRRFLEIARLLNLRVAVVTDNDGKVSALRAKYADFEASPSIRVSYDLREELPSLEEQIVDSNGPDAIARMIGIEKLDESALIKYMKDRKTDVALRVFESTEPFATPTYIEDAIDF